MVLATCSGDPTHTWCSSHAQARLIRQPIRGTASLCKFAIDKTMTGLAKPTRQTNWEKPVSLARLYYASLINSTARSSAWRPALWSCNVYIYTFVLLFLIYRNSLPVVPMSPLLKKTWKENPSVPRPMSHYVYSNVTRFKRNPHSAAECLRFTIP